MNEIQDDERQVELIDYIDVILKRKWLIIGITAISGLFVGYNTFRGTRQYQAEALVVVSQPIATTASTRSDEFSSAEIVVPGLAAQTYEALAKSDELVTDLLAELRQSSLPEKDIEQLQAMDVDDLIPQLDAEIVAATEKAESPLLSFRAKSSSASISVPMANLWVSLFIERHQGLSSNVADEYYHEVLEQLTTARENYGEAERQLRTLQASHSRLTTLERDDAVRGMRLAEVLQRKRDLGIVLDKNREKLGLLDRLEHLEWKGKWIGFIDAAELTAAERHGTGDHERQELIDLRRLFDSALSDSLRIGQRHEAERMGLSVQVARHKLEVERLRQPTQLRSRREQITAALDSFRTDLSRLEIQLGGLELTTRVIETNLSEERRTLSVAKAIVDNELWDQVADNGRVATDLQERLGEYRLVKELVNPIHQVLSRKHSDAKLAVDLARTRIGYLKAEIPRLEEELAQTTQALKAVSIEEDATARELTRLSVELEENLKREMVTVTERLSRARSALALAQESFLSDKELQLILRQEIFQSIARLESEERNAQRLTSQIEGHTTELDSLTVLRDRLAADHEIYAQTVVRFSRRLEQSRIARERAAGDIQVVSNAMIARPVPRGSVINASTAAATGLFVSTMLAFVLDYVSRAHKQKQERTPTP